MFSIAFSSIGCPIGQKSCDGSARDPIHNFMDLSDDCCSYRFTNGQVVRMILQAGLYRDLSAENVTLPEITEPTCDFPNDGFNYSSCDVESPCWIGDRICDTQSSYNTSECNLDGRDCTCERFPDDGFDYSNCTVEFPCWIGNGFCDAFQFDEYGSEECNNDGGDCRACDFPDDGFNYSSCDVSFKCSIGDGFCNDGVYNTEECNNEGGDCGLRNFFDFLGLWLYIPLFLYLGCASLCACCTNPFEFIDNLVALLGDGQFPFPTV